MNITRPAILQPGHLCTIFAPRLGVLKQVLTRTVEVEVPVISVQPSRGPSCAQREAW